MSYSSKAAFCSDDSRQYEQAEISKSSVSYNDWRSTSVKRKRTDNLKSATIHKLLPGNQTTLTAVCSLPRLTYSNRSSVSVVLTWTSHCVDGSVDRHSMHCGHVTLDSEQIMNDSLKVNSCLDRKSIQQDIAALRSASTETEVIEMLNAVKSKFFKPPDFLNQFSFPLKV